MKTPPRLTFDVAETFEILDRQSAVTFKVSKDTRTIKGLAVPFGVVGSNGFGKYRFEKGSLDWEKVKYLTHHDWTQACGNVELEETDEGLLMTAKIARGARGDEVLALTEEGVYDGLSIGLSRTARFEMDDDGVYVCVSATVQEVSGTPVPAFKDAQVRSVAASAARNQKGNAMKCSKCGKVHADGVVECQTTPESFSAEAGTALAARVDELVEKIDNLAKFKEPVGGPTLEVKEEPIYRFSGPEGAPSGFDFATDLFNAANGDGEALKRLQEFTADHFDRATQFVDTGDVNEVNPSQYRPDMFLGQAPTPTSPMFDTFRIGTLSDVTPFFWAKLDRAATNVGVADHVEDTDPADDDLVTASAATVTPVPVSGKVHITREVADQGGNPNVSALVWAEFERSHRIALETKTAALVAASAGAVASLTAAIAAGASGAVAGAALEAGLIDLQFIPDGARFEKFFGHVDLYKTLAMFENADGEKRYPIINPQNRSGISGSKFSFLEIAGYRMEPTHSLGPTSANASLSWLADPKSVHVWNSPLHRLEKLQETVAGWDLGVFGYFAGVVYDVTGLRKVSYDPTA